MMIRLVSSLLLAAGLACAASPALADDNAAPAHVPTVTRLVKIFSTLENDWNAAIVRHDGAALEKLLAPDFEMRIAAMPGRPIARIEWLTQAMNEPQYTWRNDQMAAHEYGNTIVVSYLANILPPNAQEAAATRLFIVDTWVQDAGNWRVSTRYVAPAGNASHVPGLPHDLTDIPKKY